MSLAKALQSFRPSHALVFPKLKYLIDAKTRILERWPDVIPKIEAGNEETIISRFLDILHENDWHDIRLNFVLRAFRVAFGRNFRDRPDVRPILDFVYAELDASTNKSLVNALASIYVSTYEPRGAHTIKLGRRLQRKRNLLNDRWQTLEARYTKFFDGGTAHEQVGMSMLDMEDPWIELKKIGIRDPHAIGLMDHAQDIYVEELGPRLKNLTVVEQLFKWLNPEPGKRRFAGSSKVIKTILGCWLSERPSDSVREIISERLVEQYNDPRTQRRYWLGVDELYMNVIYSWLTRENLRFFTSVVDAAQKDRQWPPRKTFWLKLYDEGLIEQAWVAFCPSAERYARTHVAGAKSSNDGTKRFGRQTKGGSRINTSILLMKIGDKIVVDGCHNYKTHIFNIDDPLAPKLFQLAYDCDRDVMDLAYCSKAHNSIPIWREWVRHTITRKVPIPTSHLQRKR